MIILKEITLINFISHAKTTVKLKPNQQFLIDGQSGSGKSSIVEGLIWGLYGKGRTDNRALIKKGTAKASVIIILTTDTKPIISYRIERNINKNNVHNFKISEGTKVLKPVKTTGIKGVQEYLEKEILHSSYLLFINSIIYPQDNVDSFVKQPASKRKDIILEIIKASDYDTYLKKTKEKLQENKTQTEVINSKIIDRQRLIKDDLINTKSLPEHKKKDIILQKTKRKAEEEHQKLIVEKNKIETSKALNDKQKASLADIVERINKCAHKLDDLNKKIIALTNINIDAIKIKITELEKSREEFKALEHANQEYGIWQEKMNGIIARTPLEHDYDKEIEEINKQLIEVIKEEVELCPKCSTPYPKAEEHKQQRIKHLEGELEHRQELKQALEAQKQHHIEEIEALGTKSPVNAEKLDLLREKIVELEPSEKQLIEAESKQTIIKDIEKDIINTQGEKDELESQKEKIIKKIISPEELDKQEKELKPKLEIIQIAIQALTQEEVELHARIAVAEEAVKNTEKSKKELKKLTEEMNKTTEDVDSLQLTKEAFGPNGIRAIVIDYVIPQLEDKINNILQKLSDFRIRLDTQRSGLGKDTVLEGLFIDVINELGESFSFDNFSGGEKVKIIVAISEALSEIQQVGFRILDELFIGLDEESIEGFVQVMLELQDRFSQLICISHLQKIKDLFDNKLLVVKTNGTSRIIESLKLIK